MTNGLFRKLMVACAFSGLLCQAQDNAGMVDEARRSYAAISENILRAAELMPALEYGFRAAPNSPTFAELVGNFIESETRICSAIGGGGFEAEGPVPRSKADAVAELKTAVRHCAAAYSSVSPANASEHVAFGTTQHSKLGLLFLNVSQGNEVYGQMAVYLRLNGLIPPSAQAKALPVVGK